MDTEGYLYETLSPLAASPTSTDHPPPATDDSEPYVVLRNQISLSSVYLPIPVTSVTDYFSLHVSANEPEDEANVDLNSTTVQVETPVRIPQPERRLEGGWFRANCRFKSPMLQLHKGTSYNLNFELTWMILDFCNFLSPTHEEQASRNAAVERVFDVIKYIWPNCEVEVFGSFKTGLYLPSSDIDAVILGSDIRTPQIGLHALSRALSQQGIAKKIQVIAKARVPIIKFVEKRSGISFDISFDLQNGPKAAEYIQEAMLKWPPLRPLCLILKIFLQQRELNEVYSGGIGSYALLAMLIAVFRNLRDSQASSEHNLGVLLVNFFDIYGRKLNSLDVGVSCNGEGTFFVKKSKGFMIKGRPMLLSIEDPQAPENDIGKSSFNYFQVRSAFALAYSTLTNSKTIMTLGPMRSILGTIIRPDAVLLERKGGSNGDMTFNTLLPGVGEPLQQEYSGQQEGLYRNWRLNEDEEEPLPRGNGALEENGGDELSGKKRKKISKRKKILKKLKESGEDTGTPTSENGSRKENGLKKKRWRHYRNGGDSNGFGQSNGGGGLTRKHSG